MQKETEVESIMPKGFHNAKFYDSKGEQLDIKCNGAHKSEIFGALELKAYNLLNGFLEKHKAIHEHKVKGKTSKGTKTVSFRFFLDFYLPLKRADLEIDPLFHKTYKPVVIRDKLRDKVLKSNLHINTIRIGALDLNSEGIRQIKAKIEAIPNSTEILDHWM